MKSGVLSVNKYNFTIHHKRSQILLYAPIEEYKNNEGEIVQYIVQPEETIEPYFNIAHFEVKTSKKDTKKFYLKCLTSGCTRFGSKHKVTLYAPSETQRESWVELLT